MKIALAQLNFTVGDFDGNRDKIISAYDKAVGDDADIIIFSESCISGYPAEDLILRDNFLKAAENTLNHIVKYTANKTTAAIISAPIMDNGKRYNAVFLVENGAIIHRQYKHDLPNYGVFDEKRVFSAGEIPSPIEFRGIKIGIMICEDMWNMKVTDALKDSDIIISINASPFEIGKHKKRFERACANIDEIGKPLIYVNQICGQDDLVFDGDSLVISKDKELLVRLSRTEEELYLTNWKNVDGELVCKKLTIREYQCEEQVIYQAMTIGLRDYVQKNGFDSVIIGMSGGIDSALTAAVAVDALGADKVHNVMMPSKFTSDESLRDAAECAANLGIKLGNIAINDMVAAFENSLAPIFAGKKDDLTEENIQARTRGLILMAISNKFNHMVLSTGNKSEMAVGYSTLYGDMCGGYSVLKDVYKMQVFALAKWRNKDIPENGLGSSGEIIPQNIITKAPTAELRYDQKDEDSLPPYEILDGILYHLIEERMSATEIIDKGYEQDIVKKISSMVYASEYKRRQSAPGVKISVKPFSRDRRYPITNWYK